MKIFSLQVPLKLTNQRAHKNKRNSVIYVSSLIVKVSFKKYFNHIRSLFK